MTQNSPHRSYCNSSALKKKVWSLNFWVGFGTLMTEGQYNFVAQDTETQVYLMKMLILKTFSLLEYS